MKKYIFSGVITLLLMGAVVVPHTHAETAVTTSVNVTMLEQIKALLAKVDALQKQLATIRGEIKGVIRDGLAEGSTTEDIKKVQELLATDSDIYPEGLTTGYFGPLTKEALKRFQKRHHLEVSGTIDSETHDLLEEYMKERLHDGFGDRIPPGLLKAPGIMKKVEDRYSLGCDKDNGGGKGMGPLCKKLKAQKDSDEDEDEDGDGSSSDDTTDFDVEVVIKNGISTISFTSSSTEYTVVASSTRLSIILEAIAKKLDVRVIKLDSDLVKDVKEQLAKAIKNTVDTSKTLAQTAIDDAEDAIEAALLAMDESDSDTTEAESLVSDAHDKLDEANTKFDNKSYTQAKTLAEKATSLAEDAQDAL